MPQSLSRVLVHIVFSTKKRESFISDVDLRSRVHEYIGGVIHQLGSQPVRIGGTDDHVHILCTLPRTLTQADLVKEIKRPSSEWMKKQSSTLHDFAWQNGYGVFSIGQSQIDQLTAYISNQYEHHRMLTFQDEFRALLDRYRVEYDERYVWD